MSTFASCLASTALSPIPKMRVSPLICALKTPLSSVKHLERSNATLADIAACEERLQTAGQTLVKALAAARDKQEQLAQAVVAHVPTLQARNTRLKELMTEMSAVATEVAGRLSDKVLLVRPGHLDAVLDELRKMGHTPQVVGK